MLTADLAGSTRNGAWSPEIEGRYPQHADLIRRYAEAYRARCKALADRSRRWFRFTGVAVILSSVTLPLLTTLSFPGKDFVVSALALGIAGLSSLRSFFHWDRSWQLFRQHEIALTAQIARWESAMIDLIGSNAADADSRAQAITREALDDLKEQRNIEFEAFFSTIGWPQRGEWPGSAPHFG